MIANLTPSSEAVRSEGSDVLAAFLKTQGVTLFPPQQYMDKFALTTTEVTPIANTEIKAAFEFTKSPPAAASTTTEKMIAYSD